MKGNTSARLRNLSATSHPVPAEGSAPATFRERLQRAAIDKGALDSVDFALLNSLVRHSGRPDDAAFLAVTACLLSAVKAGGLRIPLEPAALADRLEAFLRGLFPAQSASASASEHDSGVEDVGPLARRLAKEFHAHRIAGDYASIIGDVIPGTAPEFMPLLADGGLYFQKHHAAEASVSARLAFFLRAPDMDLSAAQAQSILDTVLDKYPLRLPGTSADNRPAMVFDPHQKLALALALRKRFTIISGGPGTGKTSLAANLLRAWTRAWQSRNPSQSASQPPQFPRVRLAAPTGRAAQRLAESLRRSLESVLENPGAPDPDAAADRFVAALPCETLHSLLRYNPGSGEFFHRRQRPLPADLVIIDEVSMVDIFALARLLEALEEGACLVLLGDMDQLPSVESGSVLADLVPTTAADHPLRDHLILLDRSHRSDDSILQVTRCINAMDGEGALLAMGSSLSAQNKFTDAAGPAGGCRLLRPLLPSLPSHGHAQASDFRHGLNDWLEAWIDFHYQSSPSPGRASYASLVESLGQLKPPDDDAFNAAWLQGLAGIFAYLDQARILTLTRKGWHGSVAVNRRIGERLIGDWDPRANASGSGSEGFNGAPIMILENDHAKGLFNGDVGILLRIQGRSAAVFRRGDGYKAFPAAFLPRHETAFAMTVHKSQGSEYDQVLLILPEAGNRLLYKETLYTALTRARYFAGVYGPKEVFLEAVGRKVIRESGLPDALKAIASLPKP